ncbi:hypothetical protein [uncultured Tenacibaculum sp.]|uniref:hypothetical protein n=1 Tax=uncultured Tenacibaculum sp. TaxID=174713 RepID=UPI00263A0C06|nr:hypothetical protein [uncultured Tenacibaculum sp.]
MLIKIVSEYIKINKDFVEKYGKEKGERLFKTFSDLLQFSLRVKTIQNELDLYADLYLKNIFPTTENYYTSKFKKQYTEGEKELLKEINKILENPKYKLSDEITLLFYVGLYHKIENYEAEILNHFNTINKTNFKDFKKIGIDTYGKKKLFEDRDRLRLISNSIKHNRFYPKKELLKYYPNLDINKKISLSDFNPKEDIYLVKSLISFFNLLVTMKSVITITESLFGKNIELEKIFLELTKDINPKEEKFKHSYLKK